MKQYYLKRHFLVANVPYGNGLGVFWEWHYQDSQKEGGLKRPNTVWRSSRFYRSMAYIIFSCGFGLLKVILPYFLWELDVYKCISIDSSEIETICSPLKKYYFIFKWMVGWVFMANEFFARVCPIDCQITVFVRNYILLNQYLWILQRKNGYFCVSFDSAEILTIYLERIKNFMSKSMVEWVLTVRYFFA